MTTHRLTIVRAGQGDAAELSGLAIAAKAHWGYPVHWLETWRGQLTMPPATIASCPTFKAIVRDSIVGFYSLELSEDTAVLEHLWVTPKMIGYGIGTALFRHAEEQARALGCIRLSILSDPNAAGFYRRMGAIQTGESDGSLEGAKRSLPRLEKMI